MKKLINSIFIIALVLSPILMNAQVYVVGPSGDVGVGTDTPTAKLDVDGETKMLGAIIEKTNGSASVLCNRTTASAFAFGAGVQGGFTVDENYHLEFRSNTRANVLNRYISTGNLMLRFRSGTGWAGFGVGNPASELHVNGSITYNGAINNASDRRLKRNINDFGYGLKEVLQLNPVSYEYNGKANFRNAGQQQIGLVAQDLKAVAPELVTTFTHEEEDAESKVIKSEEYLMINESAVKYMLVNAVKEQQSEIEDLRSEVADLKEIVNALLNNSTNVNTQHIDLNGAGAYLEQNQPNPFNTNTLIRYNIPTDATDAVVNIFDVNGQLIHNETIAGKGKGEIQLKAGTIAAGTYSYSLVVNGRIVDTKRMVIAK